MTMIETLKNSELFEGLDDVYLEKISVLCRGASYREGTLIFKEGDEAAELYILTEGRLALEMELRPVPERAAIPTALDVVAKGECFGWSALVEPYRYTLTARCLTHCSVLTIRGDILRKAMSDDPSFGYEMMKRLAKLIRLRLSQTRLRLTSGIGLVLLGKELGASE
jgi:CRP-like cAMP-binding protein